MSDGDALRLRVATATRAGPRSVNQDRVVAEVISGNSVERALACVADGMGGHRGGELASEMAVRALRSARRRLRRSGSVDDRWVIDLVARINSRIQRLATRRQLDGMGTTMSLLITSGRVAKIANIGDSRCYLLHHTGIQQVTDDHSVTADAIRRGALNPEDAEGHPYAHALTRAVGTESTINVDLFEVPLPECSEGAFFVLCSDGVWNVLDDATIEAIVRGSSTPQSAADGLVDEAIRQGTTDNATAAVVEVGDPRRALIRRSDTAGFTEQETQIFRPRRSGVVHKIAAGLVIVGGVSSAWLLLSQSDSQPRGGELAAEGTEAFAALTEPDHEASRAANESSHRRFAVLLRGVDSARIFIDNEPITWVYEGDLLPLTAVVGTVLEVVPENQRGEVHVHTIGTQTPDTLLVTFGER